MNRTYREVESISTWQHFRSITSESDYRLLQRLDDFPNAILITGCQRSGTTMLSRIIRCCPEIVDHTFGRNDELDGALILSGLVKHVPQGRYCFQTTYVDQNYREYFDHQSSCKIIWILRNPFSTVYSLVYNWPNWALDQTFRSGPAMTLTGSDYILYRFLGHRSISTLKKACLVYNWKLSHLFEIYNHLGTENIKLVEYDDLVLLKRITFSNIFNFVNLRMPDECMEDVHSRSLSKKDRLSESEYKLVQAICEPIYFRARKIRPVIRSL